MNKAELTDTEELTTKADLIHKMVPWDYADAAKPSNTTKRDTKADPKNPSKNLLKAKLKGTTGPNELEGTTDLEDTEQRSAYQ